MRNDVTQGWTVALDWKLEDSPVGLLLGKSVNSGNYPVACESRQVEKMPIFKERFLTLDMMSLYHKSGRCVSFLL